MGAVHIPERLLTPVVVSNERYRRLRCVVISLTFVAAVSGCVVDDPATPTSEQQPGTNTAFGSPVVALSISGTGFSTLGADGKVLDQVLFSSDPESASVLLSDAFGDVPDVGTVEETVCDPSSIRSSWGDALVIHTDYRWLPEGQLFSIAATAPSFGGVRISTPSGLAVGDEIARLAATLPVEQIEKSDYEGVSYVWAAYDVASGVLGSGDDDEYLTWGAAATSENGVITTIDSPVLYRASASC